MRRLMSTSVIIMIFIALATAKPVHTGKSRGIAIPLTQRSPFLNASNKIVDLDSISYHIDSARAKILGGFDNYKRNTGMMHPLAINKSRVRKRGAGATLKSSKDKVWYAEISIGAPAQTFTVEIDTGSSDMFVPRFDCGPSCEGHNLWKPRLPVTENDKGKSFLLEFADGAVVSGYQHSDRVTIADLTVYFQTFGAATSYSPFLHADIFPPDGLLGLAFPSISKYPASNLFIMLVIQKKVINPTLSFKLTSSGGEMYVGGANSMLYRGPITYTGVTHMAHWEVNMDNVLVNGENVVDNVPVIIDTGSNYVVGDWDMVAAVYKNIVGQLYHHEGYGFYTLPCNSFPELEVSLTFGGRSFPIDSKVFNTGNADTEGNDCYGGIIASSQADSHWMIGSLFLQGVYTVLDYGTLQVGFAELA